MQIVIGQSLTPDITSIADYEKYLNEGDIGDVRIYLNHEATQSQLQSIEDTILSQGVTLNGHVYQVANCVIIPYVKLQEPLSVISNSLGDLNDVVGWQIIKVGIDSVPVWIWWVGGVGIAALLLAVLRKK